MDPILRRISNSERPLARGARRTGSLDANEKVAFTIRVRRRAGAPPPSELLPSRATWGGPRNFSRDAMIARAGANQADIDRVAQFTLRQGMEVIEASAPRRSVRVRGTAAQIQRHFGVELGHYESPLGSYRGREGAVYVPDELADVVTGVFGLDKRPVFHRSMTPPNTPPGAVPLSPTEVAGLYNFPPLHPTVAKGRSIAILELGDGGFAQSDLAAFCTHNGVPTPTPVLVPVNGQSTSLNGNAGNPDVDDIETALDVQVVAAIAQGADIVVFFAGNGDEVDLITTAAFFDYPSPLSAISISWGENEENIFGDWQDMQDDLGDLSILGVPIFAASGDLGSNGYGGGQSAANDGSAHTFFPASCEWVTACGGTIITHVSGAPPTFAEDTWNDETGATGGGISVLRPVPPWQLGLTATQVSPSLPAKPLSGRGVPDIAGNASADSGYAIFTYGMGGLTGGTSAVSPLYAALLTIYAAAVGWSMGQLNPLLYQIAATTPGAFVDINDAASNELQVSAGGTTPCPAFLSTAGWDACTGLGRIDGMALLKAIILVEQERQIRAGNPFSFGNGEWLYSNTDGGADDTADDLEVGQVNFADPNDCTLITTPCPGNATFASINTNTGNGAVGLFGRSEGTTWSIGVAGESQTGVAVYGIATGELAFSPNVVGVVGRSMGGTATEVEPIEKIVDTPIGVLGHSNTGLGVRGHGGPLLKQRHGAPLLPPAAASPGGAFSSGRLQDIVVGVGQDIQATSLDALQQLRLIPSVSSHLPAAGQVGDLYVHMVGEPRFAERAPTVTMYLCIQTGDGVAVKAKWAPFTLGAPVVGG